VPTTEAVQISAIVPTLTVDDLQKSIAFYEALGFAIDERWEEKGTLLGVMLRAGKTEIGLNQDDWKKGRDRKKGLGVRLSIQAGQERRHHPQVGASRHGVEEPRVRGHRSERVPADSLFGDIGIAAALRPILSCARRLLAVPWTLKGKPWMKRSSACEFLFW
jgi:catechol 2,3-dioxygenase-like lactoylglutathione lyase family enzyme